MVCFLPIACRINVTPGPFEKRVLITGLHTVADIYCIGCEVRFIAAQVTDHGCLPMLVKGCFQ